MKYQVGDKVRLGEEILGLGPTNVMRPFVGWIGTVENVLEIHPVLYAVRLNAAVVFTLRAGEIHPVKMEQPKPDTLAMARLRVIEMLEANRAVHSDAVINTDLSNVERLGHSMIRTLYGDIITETERLFEGLRHEAAGEREA